MAQTETIMDTNTITTEIPETFAHNSADASEQNQAEYGVGMSAPETPNGYNFSFGEQTKVDTRVLTAFTELAHSQGMSQQQASEIVDFYAALQHEQATHTAQQMDVAEQQWIKELRSSGDYTNTVAHARLTMERYGSPELNALLNETRLGSHPALVRFVAKVGQELAEPKFLSSKGRQRTDKLNFYKTMTGQ